MREKADAAVVQLVRSAAQKGYLFYDCRPWNIGFLEDGTPIIIDADAVCRVPIEPMLEKRYLAVMQQVLERHGAIHYDILERERVFFPPTDYVCISAQTIIERVLERVPEVDTDFAASQADHLCRLEFKRGAFHTVPNGESECLPEFTEMARAGHYTNEILHKTAAAIIAAGQRDAKNGESKPVSVRAHLQEMAAADAVPPDGNGEPMSGRFQRFLQEKLAIKNSPPAPSKRL